MTKTILLSGGEGTRWGNYGGVPKHLFKPLTDETILDRQIRLFYGTDLVVLATNDAYARAGTRLVKPAAVSGNTWKFLASRPEWNPTGRTLLVYGDVWFAAADARKILTDEYVGLRWYGVKVNPANRYIGELLAVSFDYTEHDFFAARLQALHQAEIAGLTVGGGWRAARITDNLPLEPGDIHTGLTDPHYVDFRTWSTDFDRPYDYYRWLEDRLATLPTESEFPTPHHYVHWRQTIVATTVAALENPPLETT